MMINTIYAKAYTEVLEILKYFSEEEYSKIPEEKIKFYRKNMDKDYDFTINPNIDLGKQNISPEANSIIINLFTEYYATEEQKHKINKILDLNQEKEEKEKRRKYNSDNIFKKENRHTETPETNINTTMIEYKESFFTRFKNFIFKILQRKQ